MDKNKKKIISIVSITPSIFALIASSIIVPVKIGLLNVIIFETVDRHSKVTKKILYFFTNFS